MAKKKPPTLQQQYVLEYISKQKERVVEDDKSKAEILEIGCSLVRMWSRTVRVVKWREKWKSVVVEVNGDVSTYLWPFHTHIAFPFINFEVLEDCGYLEKFSNGIEYQIGEKRYGVKDDVVWANEEKYLSADERLESGSFRKFLEKHSEYIQKKCVI